jgi:hypothetical protein
MDGDRSPHEREAVPVRGANGTDVRIEGLMVDWRDNRDRWAGPASVPGIVVEGRPLTGGGTR